MDLIKKKVNVGTLLSSSALKICKYRQGRCNTRVVGGIYGTVYAWKNKVTFRLVVGTWQRSKNDIKVPGLDLVCLFA